jgi:hypothetical protein
LNAKFEDVATVMEKLSTKEGKVPGNKFLTVQRFLDPRRVCGVLLGRLMSVPVTLKCETWGGSGSLNCRAVDSFTRS